MSTFPSPVSAPNFVGRSDFAFEKADAAMYEDSMACFSSVSEIISGLHDVTAQGPDAIARNIWLPSRVMRAVINGRVSGNQRIELVNDATRFAFGMYAGEPDGDLLDKIDRNLEKHDLKYGRIVNQTHDGTTAESTSPTLSLDTAWRLAAKTDEPLLVMPLCHGGFLAGIQMLLYHQQNNPKSNTLVYPVRHSRDKHGDLVPHISDAELKYLREISEGRTIAIFDEDAASGHSVLETARYLYHKLSKPAIIGTVNLDDRPFYKVDKQGLWWENHKKVTSKFVLSLAANPVKKLLFRKPAFL